MTEPQLPIEYGDSGLVARNKINNSWTKLLEDVEAFRPSIGENGNWYIGTTDTGIHAEGYTTSFRVDSGYIQYKEENSNVWNNLIAVADLKGDTGNGIESVTATKSGKITTVTIEFTEDETPYSFQISDGADGQDGRDGTDGQDGQDGQDGADGVGIAGITTNKVGKITTVTVSYTDGSDPDSFEISDGADGQDGTDGQDGQDGVDGNGIASVTSSKSGKVTTVTITFTDGSAPFSFTVSDGQDGQGAGDVIGPNSAVDGNIALFDGVTGKLLKDGNKKISDLQDKIQNLDTIISNAQAGKNASDTIGNYGDVVSHDASDFATSTQGGKADTALQPNDNISELTNDSGFQTQQQVSSAISSATSNFITKSVSDLTNYYLKSETYTQTEVNNLIGAIQQFHYEIYASTSEVTTPASNVLYLIGPKGSGSDLYEEYVYTTQFVKIGETSIDLSQYVTITALNTALASYVTSSGLATILNDYVTSTDLSTTLQDYVTSSSLATTLNDYATTSAMNQALAGKANASDLSTLGDTVSNLSDEVDGKQDTLESGTNIKSVNGNSLLGSGNLVLHSSISVTLTASGWSNEEQSVTATGVTASNSVIISPAPANITDYADALIYCSAQANNSLTFTCTTAPESDIVVNVLILN